MQTTTPTLVTTPAANERIPPADGLAKRPWSGLLTFIDDVDAALHKLGETSVQTAEEATLALYFGLKELDDRWLQVQEKLLEQVARLEAMEQQVHTASDTARVRAHLGKAEILDAAREARDRLRSVERRLQGFKVKAESDASQVLKRLGAACTELSRRLDASPKAFKSTETSQSSAADDDDDLV